MTVVGLYVFRRVNFLLYLCALFSQIHFSSLPPNFVERHFREKNFISHYFTSFFLIKRTIFALLKVTDPFQLFENAPHR